MTNANDDNLPRRINCTALRTLHALERTLRGHIHDLMQIECEDADAAEAIVFAIEATASALRRTREATRTELHAAGFGETT